MKILITGIAGFVGCSIAEYFVKMQPGIEILGIDNLSRRGSENNLENLKNLGCKFFHGDIRCKEDIIDLPKVDWIIDCAANPSVLAGLEGGSQGLVNNNLTGTIYLLEKCKKDNAGFIMLSTSRVYSINELNNIPLIENEYSFNLGEETSLIPGYSHLGIGENFSTASPISLYGSTKLASEILALEYHYTFGFPVWINRCGVIAGPGQFGKIDQGIFSFWIYQYLLGKPLSFIGFGGEGKQARDLVHPYDIYIIIEKQISQPSSKKNKIINLGGGVENYLSLLQLDNFCKENIDINKVINKIPDNRAFDIPLYITDYSLAEQDWDWRPTIKAEEILQAILKYGHDNLGHLKRIG